MSNAHNTFHEMLITARVQANHTVDTMAVLLNMAPEDYERLERGKYPDDETLTRLCKLMGWNYYDAQRLIINEMIAPHPRPHDAEPRPTAAGKAARQAVEHPAPPPRPSLTPAQQYETLAMRLREARAAVGQSAEIVAMLLKVTPEEYEQIENGKAPNDEVLRRISLVFNWNYLDLVEMVRAEQASVFQPSLPGRPFATSTAQLERLRRLTQDLLALFARLPRDDQQMMLAQLELVRDTMRRHQRRDAEVAVREA